jgi:hypothetical protein
LKRPIDGADRPIFSSEMAASKVWLTSAKPAPRSPRGDVARQVLHAWIQSQADVGHAHAVAAGARNITWSLVESPM